MKTTLSITGLVLGAMLAAPITYAGNPDEATMDGGIDMSMDRSSSTTSSQSAASQPSTFVKDSAITTKIKAKLASEHLAKPDADQRRYRCRTESYGSVALRKHNPTSTKRLTIAKGTERW